LINARPVAPPAVDDDSILSFGEQWLPLGPGDARLVRLLCEHFGNLVHRDDLRSTAGPSLTDTALSVRLSRLRRQLAPLGLNIANARGRGYLLETSGLRDVTPATEPR
jgi:DNA-binding winged helix-turn-helix (wHTH) protein